MEEDWSIWETLEKRREEIKDGENIWTSIKDKLDVSKKRPKRIEEVEVKKFEHKGKQYYVVKNLLNNRFLQMSEEEYFVWEKLDGENSIRDIALAYFLKFKSMGFANIGMLISRLASGEFLTEKSIDTLSILGRHFAQKQLKYKIKLLLYKILNSTIQIRNVDSKMKHLYKAGVWIFYSKPFTVLSVVICIVGSILFYKTLQAAPGALSHLDLKGLVGAYVIITVSIITHELAHGFTTTHYGREVGGFGLMPYYGGIAAFCDTTDIWMAPRFSRFFVSFVGPYTNLFLGSLIGIFSYTFVEDALIVSILVKAGFVNYMLAILNLNPLLEWDGYYMIMDYLELPNMRKRSFRFLREKLVSKLRDKEGFSREERILGIYGIGSLIYTVFVILVIPTKFIGMIMPS